MGNSDDAEGGEGADGARIQRAVSLTFSDVGKRYSELLCYHYSVMRAARVRFGVIVGTHVPIVVAAA